VRAILAQAALAALCALALSGCIDSPGPILASSQDVFGAKLKLQFFSLREGRAREPSQAEFTWNGSLYSRSGGALREVSAFSVHPFEAGDFLIQEVPVKRPRITEYALLHKLADGVFMVWPIDEEDADEPTRAAFCGKGDKKDEPRVSIRGRVVADTLQVAGAQRGGSRRGKPPPAHACRSRTRAPAFDRA